LTRIPPSSRCEQAGDELVEVAQVRADRLLALLPEGVVHPVEADLDEREQLPRPRLEQVLGEPEALVGHLVDLPEQVVLVVGAEVRAVELVLADDPLDLAREQRRVGERALARGRQEAADEHAVERPRRVGAGDADHDRGLAVARRHVPQPRRADRRAVGHAQVVVRVVDAVAEAVDAEVAGRAARHHAAPRRHRDRRVDRAQAPVTAARHQARERRQLVAPAVEHERRLGAVEPDQHHLRPHPPPQCTTEKA
jgi:hypothetical protein